VSIWVSKPGNPLLWRAALVDSRVNKKEGEKCGKRTENANEKMKLFSIKKKISALNQIFKKMYKIWKELEKMKRMSLVSAS
jgi:hypothetical protein